ncbi:hypothetical protein AB395_0000301 [Sinorhizobium fredii CCBAU 45436]|nr:hypothetical protein SF83666_c02790 [Sinorhizobium fredii CCBAU 83666]AWI55983.1 hypothetical protein AB395_0000301 [Sinorhizobium fredii CCBAU 45436]AWM23608.1 hypothetical protein AOX55_0000327 [Sinorhizobium fredii CCBAU 25509]
MAAHGEVSAEDTAESHKKPDDDIHVDTCRDRDFPPME